MLKGHEFCNARQHEEHSKNDVAEKSKHSALKLPQYASQRHDHHPVPNIYLEQVVESATTAGIERPMTPTVEIAVGDATLRSDSLKNVNQL
jgi:hypothetical protein